jgi:hypothetical protein
MPEIESVEKLLSISPAGRFGKPRCYGRSMFAFSEYGVDEIVCFPDRDVPIEFSGIYRRDNVTGKVRYYREPYYITKNPRTDEQQAWRATFADAVTAWQNLTGEQKSVYNNRAVGKHMSGYNLFLREYLLSQ